MGGAAIPYLRFVEVNLQIPGIRNYNEDVLLLVIPTMTYSKTVPVMVGMKIIDKALSLMTVRELAKATTTMETGPLWGTHVRVAATLPAQTRARWQKWLQAPLKRVTLWRCGSSDSMMSTFGTINVWANTCVRGHCHVSTCPHRASARSPIASSSGIHSYLWGTTP